MKKCVATLLLMTTALTACTDAPKDQDSVAVKPIENSTPSLEGRYVVDLSITPNSLVGSGSVTVEASEFGNMLSGTMSEDARSTGKTSGAHYVVNEEIELAVSGKKATISFVARSSENAILNVAYSTFQVGNSGWYEFKLTPEFTAYEFTYDVPATKSPNNDYLGFFPENGKVDLAQFSISTATP